jgi:hypothetical protein
VRDVEVISLEKTLSRIISDAQKGGIITNSPCTGAFKSVAAQGGKLKHPRQVGFLNNDSLLFVSSRGTSQILRFNSTTGDFLGVFAAESESREARHGLRRPLSEPFGLIFGPDSHLYVASYGSDSCVSSKLRKARNSSN